MKYIVSRKIASTKINLLCRRRKFLIEKRRETLTTESDANKIIISITKQKKQKTRSRG